MKRTKLLQTTPCAVPQKTSKDVIAVSQIVEVQGQQALNIDLFYEGKLRGRYFADGESYASCVAGKWNTNIINNVVRMCKDKSPTKSQYYFYSGEWEWNSKEDRERALDFLNTYGIDSYENKINEKKRDRAIDRKRERIDKLMAEVPCVPEEAETWIKEKVFPGDILFFDRKKTRTTYTCTACGGHSWKKTGWKHGEKTTCPKCGKAVTAKKKQLKVKTKQAPVIILQACGQQWVERQFKAVCTWTEQGKKLQLYEQCRAIIEKGYCWGKVYYGLLKEADEFEQDFWDKNPENKRFQESYLWPGNLKEVLPYGRLEKSGLDILAKQGKIDVNKFITTFHRRPYLEYLAKAGLQCMVADIVKIYGWWGEPRIICTTAKTLKEALKLDGNRTARMKQVDGGLNTLEWLQYEQENGIRISQESLQYLSDKKVEMDDCKEILKELKSVNRMVNYMKKQKVAPSRLVQMWRDYLRMAEAEGYDTTDDIVRLPKDLKARHDALVDAINERTNAEKMEKEKEKHAALNKKIWEHLPEAKRYFWEDEKYMIIPAGRCEELIEEGRTLHHCVGAGTTYMDKMAAGRSWILFLRRKKELEKPYYTIEIRMEDDQILQYYSEFDRQPNKAAIKKVLDKFKQSVKRSRQERIQVTVTAIA